VLPTILDGSEAASSSWRCIGWAALDRALRLGGASFLVLISTLPRLEAKQAQQQEQRRYPRRVVFAIGGAAAGALISGIVSKAFTRSINPAAVAAGAAGFGAAGYLLGRDADRLHTLRFRGAPPVRPEIASVVLPNAPVAIAIRGSRVAVAGRVGFTVVESGQELTIAAHRGAGLSGIVALDFVSDSGEVVVAAGSGTYLFPSGNGGGELIRLGAASATASVPGRLFFAIGTRVETAPASADSLREWPGLDLGATVHALAYDSASAVLWAATDSGMTALRVSGDSLVRLALIAVGGTPTSLKVRDSRLAVALGAGGARVFDVSDPTAPRPLGRWRDARFVFDVAIAGPRLYAAAGQAGVYILDISATEPSVIGLARDLGYATTIAASQGYLYVLDRSRNELRRIRSPL
jgi:LVIVD repeat-containing protein